MKKNNPRYANGNLRRKYRARFKAMNAPCGICGGRYGAIHYDESSDSEHPLSFVIDEIYPISRYREFGYESPQEAANDWDNLQAAHYMCNANKSNKTMNELKNQKRSKIGENAAKTVKNNVAGNSGTINRINVTSGEW